MMAPRWRAHKTARSDVSSQCEPPLQHSTATVLTRLSPCSNIIIWKVDFAYAADSDLDPKSSY